MLPPGSRFKHYWDHALVILVLYNCILTPMQFGFARGPIFVDSSVALLVVDLLMWVLFIGMLTSPKITARAASPVC